ncbi:ATP-binding protein [Streptomyces avicenniae]|uniref:ATP-binding protein n=1 Tax=Streptomyces avicenniae TaxID=500153 RepID=UPI00069986F3|nr:ATP-binding protein [Streptomyces avicenniae]
MAETDGAVREPPGPDHDEDTPPAGGDHRVHIGGNAARTVIAGNHNVVIDAHGSTVNLVTPEARPRPVRRERVALTPRRQREPIGRETDLEELADALRGHGLVQVWGPPGVGKSTLLRHAAHTFAPGPDGVLFLDGAHREAEDLAQEIFEACYDAPGYAPTGPELRRLMAGVRVTVYLDDADLPPERLRQLADAAPDATFVFASRERSVLGEGAHLELRGLDRAAGIRLLTRELRNQLPEGQRAAADELCALSLGRPLLLLRAAGLAGFDAAGAVTLPRPAEISGLLPLLLDRLDTAAVNTLRLLATLEDAEVDPAHIGALCGVAEPGPVCGRLADLGLLVATEHGYRSAADVVPEVRRRSSEPFPAERLCDHFARWAALPTTTPAQVAAHGRALELVAVLAERQGRPDLAVGLARAVSPFLAQSLRFGVWGRLLDRGQDAARRAGDATATAYFTHEKAIRYLLIGRRVVAAVLLAEAVVLWRQLGDEEGARAALDAQRYTPPPAPPTPDAWGAGPDAGASSVTPAGAPPGGGDQGSALWSDPGAAQSGPGAGAGAPPGTAADPGAASAAHANAGVNANAGAVTPPPGADPWAAAQLPADPATQLGAHAPGAAAATTAGGGATAAAGGGALGAGLITVLLGVAVAVAVGVGIYQEQMSDDEPSASAESAAPDDLAGVWQDGLGNVFRIVGSGDGTYEFMVQGTCGESSTVEVTGGSGSYTGTMPVWDETSCGTTLGEADMTIDVASDGSGADVTTTERSDGSWECSTCGTQSWTRLS